MTSKNITTFFIFIFAGLFTFLNAQVTEDWVNIVNGPINGGDHGHDVATDLADNIYVTGWIETTTGNQDCYTVKYSSNGNLLWAKTYAGSLSGIDYGYTIITDENGNVYVGGFGDGGTGLWDIFILKYNTDGDTVWTRRWKSPVANYSAYAYSITVDEQTNVYVTGFMSDGLTGGEFITLKYNSTGTFQWASRYKGPGASIDYGNCVEVDNEGNVFVTGWSGGTNNLHDMTTIKYNSNGDSLWVRRYDGSAGDNDYAYWLDLDDSGNVYVTGQSVETGQDNNMTTIKYSSGGTQLWISKFDGGGNAYDAAQAIEIDNAGNIYIVGNATSSSQNLDCATLKYSPDGTLLWSRTYDGPASGGDLLISLVTDNMNSCYATGFVSGVGSAFDIVTLKYKSNGDREWDIRYNGTGNSYDGTYAIALDHLYNIFVTGYSTGNGTDYDYTTIKYRQPELPVELTMFTAIKLENSVSLNWQTASEVNNMGFEIQRSQNKSDFITIGFKEGNGTTTATHRYSFIDENPVTGKTYYRLKQIDHNGQFEFSEEVLLDYYSATELTLSQNYPNPFNPSTSISFIIPEETFVTIKIYDILGIEITTLINEVKEAGKYDLTFSAEGLSAGLYFYAMEAGSFKSVQKMLLLK